jgi:hypothetical protein
MSQPAAGKSLEAYELFRDPQKHYVRVYGWKNAAQSRFQVLQGKRDYGLRYLTLCGKNAIDIFLLKREGLIRDDGRGFPSVFYVENYYPSFAEVKPLLGRTQGKRISFEELVIQPWFETFVRKCPFDVVNLDFSGNCFPREDPPFSTTLRAIYHMIELQKGNNFDLFVTFKALRSMENLTAVQELAENMTKNFSAHHEVEELFREKFQNLNPEQLSNVNYGLFLLATFPKIVYGFGANSGFTVSCTGKFIYKRTPQNKPQYQIVKFMFTFTAPVTQSFSAESRLHEILAQAYVTSIVNDLDLPVIDVDHELSQRVHLEAELREDLKSVLSLQIPFGEHS